MVALSGADMIMLRYTLMLAGVTLPVECLGILAPKARKIFGISGADMTMPMCNLMLAGVTMPGDC